MSIPWNKYQVVLVERFEFLPTGIYDMTNKVGERHYLSDARALAKKIAPKFPNAEVRIKNVVTGKYC